MRKYRGTTARSNRPLTIGPQVADKYNLQVWSTDIEQGQTEVLAVLQRTGVALLKQPTTQRCC
jgi:hypothetical protein